MGKCVIGVGQAWMLNCKSTQCCGFLMVSGQLVVGLGSPVQEAGSREELRARPSWSSFPREHEQSTGKPAALPPCLSEGLFPDCPALGCSHRPALHRPEAVGDTQEILSGQFSMELRLGWPAFVCLSVTDRGYSAALRPWPQDSEISLPTPYTCQHVYTCDCTCM